MSSTHMVIYVLFYIFEGGKIITTNNIDHYMGGSSSAPTGGGDTRGGGGMRVGVGWGWTVELKLNRTNGFQRGVATLYIRHCTKVK